MSGVRLRAVEAASTSAPTLASSHLSSTEFAVWRDALRQATEDAIADFLGGHCADELSDSGIEAAVNILSQCTIGGKCLRPTFMYLGWLCGSADDDAALRAAASLELLHLFALVQDDVMDDSDWRRGHPAVHVQFAQWHRDRGLPGSSRRFGDSAATLLGDLCLVWAEKMLRESGIDAAALDRVWPRYDAMRTELAVGQLADLVNVSYEWASLDSVLDVARRKSGNYTVRRPLELGAAMSDCDERSLWLLGRYGRAVGEAFQLRDDLLDVIGAVPITGKPAGSDLRERKVTCVAAAAHQLADAPTRGQLVELMGANDLDDSGHERWRGLMVSTGAVDLIEQMITERLETARDVAYRMRIDAGVKGALAKMAAACAERAS